MFWAVPLFVYFEGWISILACSAGNRACSNFQLSKRKQKMGGRSAAALNFPLVPRQMKAKVVFLLSDGADFPVCVLVK